MSELVQAAPANRSRPLRVIGAGLGRTGTASFTAALEILLGGPALHGGSASFIAKNWIEILHMPSKPDVDRQIIYRGIHELCDGYVGVTDAPPNQLVEEFLAAYPESVVICTTRDHEKWWNSYKPLIGTLAKLKALDLLFTPLPTLRYFGTWIDAICKRHDYLHTDGSKPYQVGKHHLIIHEEYIKRVTPKDRLFFYEVKQGWEPLCKILNVPVPNVPFPHINDAEAVQSALWGFVRKAVIRWAMIFGGLAATCYGVSHSLSLRQ